jgi:hypothetical protein
MFYDQSAIKIQGLQKIEIRVQKFKKHAQFVVTMDFLPFSLSVRSNLAERSHPDMKI